MILYRANATYKEITEKVRSLFHLTVVDNRAKPVEKQVMAAVGYAAEVRIKYACDPVFQSLSNLEKAYASLNYKSASPKSVVVRNNMGSFIRKEQR